MSQSLTLRVVKVGGSLLDLSDLSARLGEWLRRQPARPTCLVVGGGRHADLIRAADRRWKLGPELAHQLALDAMSLNGRMLAAILGSSNPRRVVANFASLEAGLAAAGLNATAGLVVVELGALLAEEELRQGRSLVERSWRVTSDSLAAWLSGVLVARGHAVELVLLKSLDVDEKKTLVELQQAGVIDECFCEYAAGLSGVRFVNLRGS